MKRITLVRAASPLVLGRLTSAALTFALPLLLARALDARGFGTYKQLFLVAQTVLLIGQLGLTQSLYYFLPKGHAERGVFVGQALTLLLVPAALAGIGLGLAGSRVVGWFGGGGLSALTSPLALLAAGMLLAAPLEAGLTSEGRVGLAGMTYVISDGTRAALLLWGARTAGLAGVAWAGAAWACLRVVGLATALALGVIPVARPRRASLRAQLAYALPFAGSVLLFVGQKQFTQYAVAARFDAATFALFSVAAFHLPVVDIIYSPIADVLMVQLGRGHGADRAQRLAAWDDAVEKLASVLWPAAACAWLFGATILPLLFSQRYAGSVPLFLLATAEIPLWVLPVDPLLRAAGETRFLFTWYGLRLFVTVSAVLLGLRYFGLAGAFAGSIASEALSRAVMLRRGVKLLGVTARRALDPGLWRIAGAAAMAALPALALRYATGARASLVSGIVLYGATYVALRLAWRARPRREESCVAVAS